MSSSWEDPPKTVQEDPDKDLTKTVQEDPGDHTKTLTEITQGNWTYFKDKSEILEVRCNLCPKNLDLKGVPESKYLEIMAAHQSSPGHKKKKKQILEDEENKRLEAMNTELVQDKVKEILACCEDHPRFLHHVWVPFGSFLKVFKMVFHPPYQSASEFLVTAQHDESEIIFEILDWLDKDP